MIRAPIPPDEASRQAKLRETGLVDSPPEVPFENAVQLASLICGTPVALVSLVAANRQWFKARVGLEATQTGRDESFCGHAVTMSEPLVVHDAQQDPRFHDNPLVLQDPSIRFYAGVPLRIEGGSAVGTLCVVDRVPRELTQEQLRGLILLARQLESEIALRRERAVRASVPPFDGTTPNDTEPDPRAVTVSSESSAGEPPELPTNPGDVVGGRYVVERVVGRGGMGIVVKASDLRSGESRALKILLGPMAGEDEDLNRFAREARLLASLDSERVARIYDVGNLSSGLPFIAMEYVEGVSLEALLQRSGALEPERAARILKSAATGVADAHAAGIVHRDLKPSNLVLLRESPDVFVKLLDFGVAKGPMQGELATTTTQQLVGTVHFMAPEQVLDAPSADTRSDVWSLGCIAYEMLAGEMPFRGENVLQVCSRILLGQVVPIGERVPGAPRELTRVIERCMQSEPSARFASAAELRDALEEQSGWS